MFSAARLGSAHTLKFHWGLGAEKADICVCATKVGSLSKPDSLVLKNSIKALHLFVKFIVKRIVIFSVG